MSEIKNNFFYGQIVIALLALYSVATHSKSHKENEIHRIQNILDEIGEVLSMDRSDSMIQVSDDSYIKQNEIQTTNDDRNPFSKHYPPGSIFVLTMPQRKQYAKWIMNKFGIANNTVVYFDAIQGKYLQDPSLIKKMKELNIVHPDFLQNRRHVSKRANYFNVIACYLGHVAIWNHLLKHPSMHKLMVFEDDVIHTQLSIPTLHWRLNGVMEEFKTNPCLSTWDYINFAGHIGEKNKAKAPWIDACDSRNIFTGYTFSTQAYTISKNGIRKLIQNFNETFPIEYEIDAKLSHVDLDNHGLNKYGVRRKIFWFNECLGSNTGNTRNDKYMKRCCRKKHKFLPPNMHLKACNPYSSE